ncbi:MAG: dTMP kinase [bacterium]|nr:dTMP kinase [bacterium]MDO8742331.1 dTMP kinase [bacterium]
MRNAKYIVIDGMDGCGKGTQVALLKQVLDSGAMVHTREPGGTALAEDLRSMILGNLEVAKSTPFNNLLLFFAAREDHLHRLVSPVLKSGRHVFSDRGDSSTFAFQICGEENHCLMDVFCILREQVFLSPGRRCPDLYVILDLPAGVARKRVMKDRRREVTHFDARDLGYYKRVRKGFREFASFVSASVVFVDATKSPQEVHRLVLAALATKGIVPK